MRSADQVLKAYAQAAENISRNQIGQGPNMSTLDGLLELVSEEDRDWFDKNYRVVYKENFGKLSPGLGTDPRLLAAKVLIDRGLDRRDYTVEKKDDLNRMVTYKLKVPTVSGPKNVTISVKKGKDKKWRVEGFAAGKIGR
jgi:hypothetical protein